MARQTQLKNPSSTGFRPLSEREKEILALLVEGCTNKEIAMRLSIAHGTVRIHVNHIFIKMNVRRRTDAAVKCLASMGACGGLINFPLRQ